MDLLIGNGADANRKLLIDAYAARKRPLEPSSEGSGDKWPTRAPTKEPILQEDGKKTSSFSEEEGDLKAGSGALHCCWSSPCC